MHFPEQLASISMVANKVRQGNMSNLGGDLKGAYSLVPNTYMTRCPFSKIWGVSNNWINAQFWSTSRGTFDKNNLAPIAYTFVGVSFNWIVTFSLPWGVTINWNMSSNWNQRVVINIVFLLQYLCCGWKVVPVCGDPLCTPISSVLKVTEGHWTTSTPVVDFELAGVAARSHHELLLAHHRPPKIWNISLYQLSNYQL